MEKEKVKGFLFISIIIVVAIIALIAGAGLYWNSANEQKSIHQIGVEKIEESKELKNAIENRLDQTVNEEGTATDDVRW